MPVMINGKKGEVHCIKAEKIKQLFCEFSEGKLWVIPDHSVCYHGYIALWS